jgi:DNA polymerase-3 subunit gamma/tau
MKPIIVSEVDCIVLRPSADNRTDLIREIVEAVKYRPAASPVKVVVIEGAEGLSEGAVNALVHVFKDPPEHVQFVIATRRISALPGPLRVFAADESNAGQ